MGGLGAADEGLGTSSRGELRTSRCDALAALPVGSLDSRPVTQPVITRDATLADDWPAPRSSRVPRWVRFALPVALLSIVGALVYAGHGFDPYRSRISYRTPGQTVAGGRGARVHAVRGRRHQDDAVWKVVVYGTCRNTSDTDLLDYQLAQRALRTFDPVSRTFGQSTSRSLWFGGTGQVFRSSINPGLATQYCRLSDELPASLDAARAPRRRGVRGLAAGPDELQDRRHRVGRLRHAGLALPRAAHHRRLIRPTPRGGGPRARRGSDRG